MCRQFIIIGALLLCGCTVGPDYKKPDIKTPAVYRYEQKDAQDTANTDWWKAFNDPVLDSLIQESLANNYNIQIAAANVEQAAGFLTETRSAMFPQATYNAAGARSRLAGDTRNSYGAVAGATWDVDLWGRVRRLSEAARADLLATEEARRGVILSLVSSVADGYIQLRGLDTQLDVSKRTLASYAESLKLFELQFQHGQVSKMIVEQSRSQYETAASVISSIESQIAQTEDAMNILLGRNPGPIPRGKTVAELGLPPVPSGLPSELLLRRPDLAQAEQNLIAANAQIGAAKALYFPSISLTGSMGTASSQFDNLFKGQSRTWSYGGSVTGPIFTAGAISGQVKQAEAAQQAALLGYKNAIISAFSDVESSLIAREKLAEQTKSQEALVASLKEYDRLAWLQYNEGYTQYLTVLYAESQLFSAELSYVQTKTASLVAYVTIYQSMGGGWVNNAEKLTEQK
jgi:outer membrane protein, multidrug efflux system